MPSTAHIQGLLTKALIQPTISNIRANIQRIFSDLISPFKFMNVLAYLSCVLFYSLLNGLTSPLHFFALLFTTATLLLSRVQFQITPNSGIRAYAVRTPAARLIKQLCATSPPFVCLYAKPLKEFSLRLTSWNSKKIFLLIRFSFRWHNCN